MHGDVHYATKNMGLSPIHIVAAQESGYFFRQGDSSCQNSTPRRGSCLAFTEQVSLSSGTLRESERTLIMQALADSGGNLADAAARLGIHRVTLYRKLKKYGIF